jgi:lipoprotein-releasing system permease protein
MTISVVMAVMTGFQVTLREKILGADAHIIVRTLGGQLGDWESAVQQIRDIPGVQDVSAYTSHQGLLRVSDRSSGLIIRGIVPESGAGKQLGSYLPKHDSVSILNDSGITDVTLPDGSTDQATIPPLIVGQELARTFSLAPGSVVSILSPKVASSPFGLVPKFRRFQVASVYRSGLVEYESGVAYTSLRAAQEFFKMGNMVSGLEVRVQAIDDASKISKLIMDRLSGAYRGVYVQDWTETNRAFFEALALEKKVYFIVLLLIIVMASFSIISSLVMIVIEKRRDIAILKTLGARTQAIGNIFRMQGAIIGVTGVSAGLIGGYGLCRGLQWYRFPIDERIFQMASLPIHIDPINFIAVGVAAFSICCLATIYPARRASRFEPAEILRHE